MKKEITPIYPINPPHLHRIFNLLVQAGAEHFALFGGAARDTDFAARRKAAPRINDYDLRVWLPRGGHEALTAQFARNIETISGTKVDHVPSAGTGRLRYCLDFNGADLDISIRPVPMNYDDDATIPVEAVAIDRAADADIGLCSVAIDPLGIAWATKEYVQDQENNTLSVYPIDDYERRNAYAARMQAKFLSHDLLWLKP